jgi:hypothetical protein
MQPCYIKFRISATDVGLSLQVKLDGLTVWQGPVGMDWQDIQCEFDDSKDAQHRLEIAMTGKLPEHTQLNDQGHIVADRMILIRDLALDDIVLNQVFYDQAQYHHDNNGNTAHTTQQFYGDMGCNGQVNLDFTSPVYMWLLENM